MDQKTVRQQAGKLAKENKKAEPRICKIFWFPSGEEIRLIELKDSTVPALSGHVEPFYFGPSAKDGLTAPSAIAIIRTEEFGRLKLPSDWGEWGDAVEMEVGK